MVMCGGSCTPQILASRAAGAGPRQARRTLADAARENEGRHSDPHSDPIRSGRWISRTLVCLSDRCNFWSLARPRFSFPERAACVARPIEISGESEWRIQRFDPGTSKCIVRKNKLSGVDLATWARKGKNVNRIGRIVCALVMLRMQQTKEEEPQPSLYFALYFVKVEFLQKQCRRKQFFIPSAEGYVFVVTARTYVLLPHLSTVLSTGGLR